MNKNLLEEMYINRKNRWVKNNLYKEKRKNKFEGKTRPYELCV